jgi:hypothetical protein
MKTHSNNEQSQEENLTIAKAIKAQLLYYDTNLIMCLGSHNFRGSSYNDEEGHNGFLEFNVSNLRDMRKGLVRIELNYSDLYRIKIYRISKSKELELFSEVDGVYEDMLTATLENLLGS